jgi:hypothetical protein
MVWGTDSALILRLSVITSMVAGVAQVTGLSEHA